MILYNQFSQPISNGESYKKDLPFITIQLSEPENVPEYAEKKGRKEYILYGTDNKYPKKIYDIYQSATDHGSILRGLAEYTLGNGFELDLLPEFFRNMNDNGDTINDIFYQIALDFLIFNGFALDFVPTAGKDLYSSSVIEFENLRLDSGRTTAFYCKDFGSYEKNLVDRPLLTNKFDLKKFKTTHIYYCGSSNRTLYPIPVYAGGLNAILTSIQIPLFNLNAITSGFAGGNKIINFNNGEPAPEIKKEIEEKVNEKYAGAKNANRLIVSFNEDKEHATTVDSVPEDQLPKRFQMLEKSTQDNIYSIHRITSPQLFGVPSVKIFSKTEFSEAWDILQSTIIKHTQNKLISELNKCYGKFFKDFKFDISQIKQFTIGDVAKKQETL